MGELKHALEHITSKTQDSLHDVLQELGAMNLQDRLNKLARHQIDAKVCTERNWKRTFAEIAGCSYQNIRQAAVGEQTTMAPELLRRLAVWSGVSERFMVHGLGPMLTATEHNLGASDIGGIYDLHPLDAKAPLRFDTDHVTKQRRAPLISWARLGIELHTNNELIDAEVNLPVTEGVSGRAKWSTATSDLPRFGIRAGNKLLFEPVIDSSACQDGDIYLFQTVSGSLILAEFRRLASSAYEAVPESGLPLESGRHGIRAIAELVAIYKR